MAETSVLRILYHVHHSLKPGSLSCCQMTYKCSLLNLPWPLLSLMEDRTEFHIRQCQGCHVSHQMPASGSGSPRWKSCAQRAASSLNYQRTCLCKHTARNPMTGAFAWTCLSFVEGYSHSTLRLEKSHSKNQRAIYMNTYRDRKIYNPHTSSRHPKFKSLLVPVGNSSGCR